MRTTQDLSGIKPVISGTLALNNSNTIQLINTDFVADTLTFKSGTSNSNELTIGAAIIGSMSFSLMNDTGKFSGLDWYDSKVRIELTCDGTMLDMGEFWVVRHHEIGNIVTVECYDALKILDEYQLYELNLTFPSTVATVVNAIASAHGFNVYGLANGSLSVPDPKNDKLTQRAVISYLAQITGQFVKAQNKDLTFKWYDTTQYEAGTTFSHDLSTSPNTLTGVSVTSSDETATQSRGTGSQIEISDNPFISADNISAVADAIYAAIQSVPSYYTGDVSIMASPAIESGDVLKVKAGNTSTWSTIIATNITYKPQLQERVTSDGDPGDGDLRINRAAYIKKQANQAISDQLADDSSELSQAIADAGGGSTSMQTTQSIHTMLKEWTPTASRQCYIAEIDKSGSMTMHKITQWGLDDQMVVIPSYDYCNHLATRAKKSLNAYGFNMHLRGHVAFQRDGSSSTEYVYFIFNIPRCYWVNGTRITLSIPGGNFGHETMALATPQWYRGWFEPTESTEEYAKGDPTYYIAPGVFGATTLNRKSTSPSKMDWEFVTPTINY